MSIVSEALNCLEAGQSAPAGAVLPRHAETAGSRHYLRSVFLGVCLVATGVAAWSWYESQRPAAPVVEPQTAPPAVDLPAAPPPDPVVEPQTMPPAAADIPEAAAPAAIIPEVAPPPATPVVVPQTAQPAANISDAGATPPAAPVVAPPTAEPAANSPDVAEKPRAAFPQGLPLDELARQSRTDVPLAGGANAGSWIRDGWTAFGKSRLDSALAAWEAAFKTNGAEMTVMVPAVYRTSLGVQKALLQLRPALTVFAVRAPYLNYGQAYYLLVAGDKASTAKIEREVAAATGMHFVPRLAGAAIQARMAAPAEAGEKPAASKVLAPATASGASVPVAQRLLSTAARAEKQDQGGHDDESHNGEAPPDDSWTGVERRVRIAIQERDFQEAAHLTEQLTAKWPNRAQAWLWRGTALLGAGRIDDADRSLERALALDGALTQAWLQRALVAQERNDHAGALRLLEEANKLASDDPDIYLNMGISYQATGKRTQAMNAFRMFMTLTEGRPKYARLRSFAQQRLTE